MKVQGYNNGGDDADKACLVANGVKAALVEHTSESALPWMDGLPQNTFDNPEYFQVGLYWNQVQCTVDDSGELTLGVESPNISGGHVVIFDNFRLEYLGTPTSTGISSMHNSECIMHNDVYNLKGQKVNKAQKGVYIQNGRLVVK